MSFGSNSVTSDPSTPDPALEPAAQEAPPAVLGHPAREMFAGIFTDDEILQVENIAHKTLENLARAKSYFRENDVLHRVMEKSQKDMGEVVEQPGFEAMAKFIVQHLNLITIGDTGQLAIPEIAEQEKTMLALAGYETDEHVLDPLLVADAIRKKTGISDEQTAAVEAACLSDRRVTVIEGTAGAGKSFTMQAIKDAYERSGYTVLGTALGWNAAKVLESSAGLANCVAMAGLLEDMERARKSGIEYFRQPTLLIVDEAGMVGAEFMYRLLDGTHQSKQPVKVVLTGDSLQLSPVDAGNALHAIVEFHGTTRIDTIRRQKRKSHRIAVKRFSQREAGKAIYPFMQQEALQWCENKEDTLHRVVRDFLSYKQAFPDKKALILALSNKDVVELNKRVRAAYRKMGLISGPDAMVQVTDGRDVWEAAFAIGDELVVRANSKDLLVYEIPKDPNDLDVANWKPARTGVFNRNIGKVAAVMRSRNPVGSYDLYIDLMGELPGRIILNTQKFRHREKPAFPVVHNFATTIYASQGQTVNKVLLIDNQRMEFRLAYVGMSRHTDSVDVYLDEDELHQRMDKMLGKVDSPVDDPQVPAVPTARYRRTEMLQTVASHWAKNSMNHTIMMFDRERRLGSHKPKVDEQALALVVQGSSEDPVTDFDETYRPGEGETLNDVAIKVGVDPNWMAGWKKNVRKWNGIESDEQVLPAGKVLYLAERTNQSYPLIDLDALMALPDQITGTELPLSGAPAAQTAAAPNGKPLRVRHDSRLPPVPARSASEQGDGLLEQSWAVPDLPFPGMSPPATPVAANDAGPVEIPVTAATRVEVPMLPAAPVLGTIDDSAMLRFNDGPQGVSDAMLNATRDLYWGTGRGDEPRIFARDRNNTIVARYALDGRCVVGEGYPPMLLNVRGTPTTPILIAPGAKEWLWAYEHNQHKNDPAAAPHVVWGASGVDWQWIAPALKGKAVKIARGRHNPEHVAWAVALQQDLWSTWGVQAEISPRLTNHPAPWTVPDTPASPPVPSPAPAPSGASEAPTAPATVPAVADPSNAASPAPPARRSMFFRR